MGANTSYNVGLSEAVSVILESLYSGMESRAGVISTDDMLARKNMVADGVQKEGGFICQERDPLGECIWEREMFCGCY